MSILEVWVCIFKDEGLEIVVISNICSNNIEYLNIWVCEYSKFEYWRVNVFFRQSLSKEYLTGKLEIKELVMVQF